MKAKRLRAAAARLQRHAGGPLDVALILGSGLAGCARERMAGSEIPYEKLHLPRMTVAGHPGIAYVGMWAGKRVVAFAGRAHLYAGASVDDVSCPVRLAAQGGATTIVLTNAAGGLNAEYAPGDVMLIADHLNFTGASPLDGSQADPFVDTLDAYAPRLRALARAGSDAVPVREGVYAGVRGPHYETRAEAESLRRLGADAVGMSTVLETIAARSLGLDVLGLSLISNAGTANAKTTHEAVLAAAQDGAGRIAAIIEAVLAAL